MSSPAAQPFLSEEPASEQREVEFNISEYLGMVRRHWKLVALAVLVAVVAAGVHFAVTPKEYMATSTIQIERRNLSPVGGSTSPWYENFWNLEFYPTQYELLQSRGLAERVVRSMDLMSDPQFNPGAAAAKERTGTNTAEQDEATLGNLALQLKGGLAVEPVRSTQLVRLSFRSSSPEFAAKAANAFAESFIDMGVEDRYASAGKASTFLGSQIETLKQEISEKESQLQAFSRRTDIVTLDPEANVVLQRLETLNSALMDAKKARIEKESRYHEVMTGRPEAVADSLAPGVIGGLRTQQLQMEKDYDTKLKTFKPEWPEMISLETQIEKGREHIDAVVREMVSKARSNAEADYQTVLRQEQSLGSELTAIKKEAIDQSSAAVQFTNLKVEIGTRRSLLDELLRRQSETEVAVRLQDTRESNVRIIDHALMPSGPFRPSLRKDLTYGLLFGLLIGIGAALLIEFLDRTVKTPEEVERRFGLATLAVIQDIADVGKTYGYSAYGYGDPLSGERPRVRPGKVAKDKGAAGGWLEKKKGTPGGAPPQIELVPHERPRTLISESYRSLRTALLLSSARELKLVAVTSAMAGEGKTATASNLAVVLAQLGRPVLIMDCDLRKPRLHQVFKVSNRIGLVNQLTGTADLDEVIAPTEVPNLWVLPSGPMPPNPSELLASERLRELLRTLRGRFDYVIVDTPPALAVTDATLVGALADGVVLTLRSHKVTREEVRLVRDRLRQADIKVLGAVLNRYRALQAGVARGYRYAEAYGYGAEESGSKAGIRRLIQMIDLHCHILPGVDDGAPTLEAALAMCRLAADEGCEAMVATPHQRRDLWWNDDVAHLRELAGELQEKVREALGDSFRVLLGGEIHVDREVLSAVEKLPGGTILSLAGTRSLLLELDNWSGIDDAVHLIHEVTVAGWRPILAHPELIPWLDVDKLERLVALGAMAQVTAMSVTGDFGRRPMQNVHQMIDAGLVHFLASDAHDVRRRPPGLRRACLMIAGRWGDALARRLSVDNPRAVLEDRPLPPLHDDVQKDDTP